METPVRPSRSHVKTHVLPRLSYWRAPAQPQFVLLEAFAQSKCEQIRTLFNHCILVRKTLLNRIFGAREVLLDRVVLVQESLLIRVALLAEKR